MRGVDGKRRQDREDRIEKMVLQPVAIRIADVGGIDQHNAGLAERPAKVPPAGLLVARQRRNRLADMRQLLAQRLAVVAEHGDTLPLLPLEASDAHHEELVQVIG